MEAARTILKSVVDVSLEAAPWLALGLIAAGLVRAFMPTEIIARWMGGRGAGSVTRAAVLGAPLPLCSCGVLPVAIGLRKGGASKGATASFLVATPETGLDSIALSYALLGPFFAIVRPIAAVVSAIATGLAVTTVDRNGAPAAEPGAEKVDADGCCSEVAVAATAVRAGACCGDTDDERDAVEVAHCGCEESASAREAHSCCASAPVSDQLHELTVARPGLVRRAYDGLAYSFTGLLSDIGPWLAVGLLFAGVMRAVVEPGALASLSGFWAMIAALVAGVPLYICASASTPVAAGLLATGVAPGVALVLLMAGPATNIGSIGVLRKELGAKATAVFVGGVCVMSLLAGLLVDYLVVWLGVDISAQISAGGRHVPHWLAVVSAVVLLFFGMTPVWRRVGRLIRGGAAAEARR